MSARELQTCDVGALTIAYRVTGEGQPLILFHGGEGDHQIYDKLQDALGPSIKAISFDQRDCGHTRYRDPQPYGIKDVAEDAVRLLDALGYASANVLGNSIGGVIAQTMAVCWPERVDRLILGLTWPVDERLQDLNPDGIAKRAEYAALGEAGIPLMAELATSSDYVRDHPEILTDLASLKTEPLAEARQRRAAIFGAPPEVDPGQIRQETLIIGGEADQLVPAAVTERLMSKIPRATFRMLPGAGHLAARQFPEELAALIRDFLDG